jgi:hypothetical protein
VQDVDPLDLVETLHESLLVLDPDLTVRFASRALLHHIQCFKRGEGGQPCPSATGLNNIYEQSTLELLQSIFDSVWPVAHATDTSTSREDVARWILAAYRDGNSSDQIKQVVLSSLRSDNG